MEILSIALRLVLGFAGPQAAHTGENEQFPPLQR